MRSNLATYLDDFDRLGRNIAVVQRKGVRRHAVSYGELASQARRFAALLEGRGIEAGERVVLWAGNSAEWIAAFYGCLLRGAVAVPLDAAGGSGFAEKIIAEVSPRLVAGDAALLRQLPEELPCPLLALDDLANALPRHEADAASRLGHETPLQILFTSGTTGNPKGVVITHGNVLASIGPIEAGAAPYMRYERLIHPLRILLTPPLSHVFGQTMGLWIPPLLRGELHLENQLIAARMIHRIHDERISVLAAVPRVLDLLKTQLEAERPQLGEEIAASAGMKAWQRWLHFRSIHRRFGFKFWAFVSGGSALSAEIESFWSALGFVVIQGYGMTESTALITLNHPFHAGRGTIGKAMAGREVKIAPDGEMLVKGAMIAGAVWSAGAMMPRGEEWLATGDLAAQLPGGEYKFLGRKSEVIVTGAGVNLHPEDLEAAFEGDRNVAAVAVLPFTGPHGSEPCAVLALRNREADAGGILARANARLAGFQQIREARIWPEPDLPRNSAGKIRRKELADWLNRADKAGTAAGEQSMNSAERGEWPGHQWLAQWIASFTGKDCDAKSGNDARLSEDLGLDSLARVQLTAAIEERFGAIADMQAVAGARTLGELRRALQGGAGFEIAAADGNDTPSRFLPDGGKSDDGRPLNQSGGNETEISDPDLLLDKQVRRYIYPRWPWRWCFRASRALFIECVARPLIWLLAAPKVTAQDFALPSEPLLVIANHVTKYDAALVLHGLPAQLRRRVAVAMMGEMLENLRHFHNPEAERNPFDLLGPLKYFLITWLFNVFPLPRYRNFQQSFEHAGRAMDAGYNVLIFPEGTRSKSGELARFKGGTGLLVKETRAAVLPVALRGLGPLRNRKSGWFHSGAMEIRIGRPLYFSPDETEKAITARLESAVARLLVDGPAVAAPGNSPPPLS